MVHASEFALSIVEKLLFEMKNASLEAFPFIGDACFHIVPPYITYNKDG
jgi:hypothetical protein